MRSDLPLGTVTFVFTDIEESTALLQKLGDGYADVLGEHRRIVRGAFGANGRACEFRRHAVRLWTEFMSGGYASAWVISEGSCHSWESDARPEVKGHGEHGVRHGEHGALTASWMVPRHVPRRRT